MKEEFYQLIRSKPVVKSESDIYEMEIFTNENDYIHVTKLLQGGEYEVITEIKSGYKISYKVIEDSDREYHVYDNGLDFVLNDEYYEDYFKMKLLIYHYFVNGKLEKTVDTDLVNDEFMKYFESRYMIEKRKQKLHGFISG